MSYLLEPNFKTEQAFDQDAERSRASIGRNKLGRSCWIFLEKIFDEWMWLVEGGKRLKNWRNLSITIDASKALLDAVKPISREIPEGAPAHRRITGRWVEGSVIGNLADAVH